MRNAPPATPHRRGVVLFAAVLALLAALPPASRAQDAAPAIRRLLEDPARPPVLGVTLGAGPVLAAFYRDRGWAPAWTDAARVAELLGLLAAAPEHGLDPADFFLGTLQGLPAPADAAGLAARDVLLTEALVRYGYMRRFGKVNPKALEPAWNFERGFANGTDAATALAAAVAAPSLRAWLDAKLTGGLWYRQLQAGLARYRDMASRGGWGPVPDGPVVRPGELDARVPALRARLAAEGDLAPDSAPPAEPERMDAAVVAALEAFQARHALDVDGALGPATRRALDVPVDARIDQLRMSLERVRWLSAGATPATYVVVNVAGFRVGFVKDGRLAWNSRVVVGRAARQTPIFRDTMTYVELNPTWTVPPTILRQDILPKVRKDPGYLRRENISVIDRSGRIVDPASVNWSAYRTGVPYTLRQEPGPENSLGRIKLMFPNEHAVYLHDTPAKALFAKSERTFSSGCIRVEDPLALAELVLDDPAWTREKLEAAIAEGKTRRVNLRTPVPVLLVYLTAIADPDGTVRFYRDVYDRDAALLQALDGPVRLDVPEPARGGEGGKVGTASL